MSGYYLHKFIKEGVLPYESPSPNPHHISGEDNAKDNAWSTEIETGHHGRDSADTDRGGNQHDDEYALLNSTETDEGRHPGRPLSWGEDRMGGPGGGVGGGYPRPYADYRDGEGANALSPGGYEDYRMEAGAKASGGQPAHVGSGYSFGR